MIYFTRHGQTQYNLENRLQGVSDSPLTSLGIKQAENLRDFCLDNGINRILVSDLPRAIRTAQITKIPYEVDATLREICYGEWETQKKDYLKKLDLWEERIKNRYIFKHPGFYNNVAGESYADLYARIEPLLKSLNESENLLIVSHIGVLRCVSKYYNNLPDEKVAELEFENNSVLCLKEGRLSEVKI